MSVLVLIGGESPEAAMDWARVGEDGALLDYGPLETAPKAQGRVVLTAPGADVQVRRLEIAARSEAQARAAAPFLFEGELAGDADGLHFAIGAAEADGAHRLAAAIDAERLGAWLARCREAGFDPQEAYADFTVWPVEDGAVAIADLPGRTLVSAGARGGYAIETALAPALYASWRKQTGADGGADYIGADAGAWRAIAAPLRDSAAEPAALLAKLAAGAARAPDYAPNLLQGAFAPAGARQKSWQVWRFAAALALIALALHGGRLVWAGVQDRAAAAAITAEARAAFAAIDPNADAASLRARVTAMLNRAEQAGRQPVLALTDPLITALSAHPQARLDEIRHEAPARRVMLRLSALDAAEVEAAVAALTQAGVTAQTQDISAQDGRMVARVEAGAP